MASSPKLPPFDTKATQLAESPVISPEHLQGSKVPVEDLMVTDNNNNNEGQQRISARSEVRTPELQTATTSNHISNNNTERASSSNIAGTEGLPISPGQIPNFDWEEFEALYDQALAKANDQEQELLQEFDSLVKYFNVWASAASAHDHERAVKRLQTRERYVRIAEQSLSQRKQHLTEVVRAFQSALALLSQN